MEGKKWYQSKAVWAAVLTGAVGVAHAAGIEVPNWVIEVFIGLGLYGVRDAVGKQSGLK